LAQLRAWADFLCLRLIDWVQSAFLIASITSSSILLHVSGLPLRSAFSSVDGPEMIEHAPADDGHAFTSS